MAFVVLVAGISWWAGDRAHRHRGCDHAGTQRTVLRELADRSIDWAAEHPDGCPTLHELLVLADRKDSKDFWGRELLYACRGNGDALDVLVISIGKDGRAGTGDDLASGQHVQRAPQVSR